MKKLLIFIFIFPIIAVAQTKDTINSTIDIRSIDPSYLVSDSDLNRGLEYAADAEYIVNNFVGEKPSEKDCINALEKFDLAINWGVNDSYTYFEKAYCEFTTKKYQQAIEDFTISLKVNRQLKTRFFEKNNNYFRVKSSEGKEGYCIASTDCYYKFKVYETYFYRGEAKRLMQDYRGAILDFTEIEKYESDNPTLYSQRGICKFHLENYLSAKNDLTKAISLGSDDPLVLLIRGGCNYNLGFKNSACIDWSKAGELGQSDAYDNIKKYCNQ